MKILHVLDHSLPLFSGYSFRSRSIIRAQRSSGLAPVVLTSPKHGSDRDGLEEIEGIRYYRLASLASDSAGNVPFVHEIKLMLRMTRSIEAVAKQERADLIHSHSPLLNGLPALWVSRRLKIPLVYEARAFWEDAAVDHGTFAEGSFRYRVSRALETFLFKHTDHTVTICEAMRQELGRRGVEQKRVSVVPNGVDIEEFTPMKRSAALADRLGLNGGPIFGFIGSFYHYEGLRFLVEAFPQIRRQIPNARLILVGGGEEEAALKALAGASEGVVFAGPVPHNEVKDYYSLVDVFVCPRLRMRLTELVTPLKPLESMAMGKAILASDVGGHRELIENGRTGLLFAPENREDLVQQSVRLAGDPALRRNLGEAGRHFVASERSWDKLARRYVGIYKELLVAHHKNMAAPTVGCDSIA
ncbi:MAG: TIGR04063 family PEP-CTERM/XrtA system glycosyltransferase [Candidatus Binatia bacterium]